jgi:predicted transcriptional regulator
MKGVDTIARVRREFFVRGKTIKEICRELHVSRNTVRKIIRSGATEFEYERRVQPQPMIGPWRDDLERLLAINAARPVRERLTLMRIFEELRALGYEGSYDAIRRYAAGWRRRRSQIVPEIRALHVAPGSRLPLAGHVIEEWADA